MTANTVPMYRELLVSVVLATNLIATAASGQVGLSARFSNQVATISQDLVVRIEVDDPVNVITNVIVEIQKEPGSAWIARPATLADDGWWWATFTSTTVWNPGGANSRQPELLNTRARLEGERGGTILRLGYVEPFEMAVLAPAEAAARARVMQNQTPQQPEDEAFQLTGYVGVEARAGSSARARAFIGAGGAPSARSEVGVGVSVGPSFSEPDTVQGGGPLVLGFELFGKLYNRSFVNAPWALFLRPDLRLDLRLPGVDPGAGLRAGLQVWIGPEIGAVVSLGGAALALAPEEGSNKGRSLGFTGGLRVGLRFGPGREDAQ